MLTTTCLKLTFANSLKNTVGKKALERKNLKLSLETKLCELEKQIDVNDHDEQVYSIYWCEWETREDV